MNPEMTVNLMQDQILERIFTPAECERIQQAPTDAARTAAWAQEQSACLPHFARQARFRQDLLADSPENDWINERLLACLQQANRNFYHFELDYLAGTQLIQLEAGDYWLWHLDIGLQSFSLRKLTLAVFLDPPEAAKSGHVSMVMTERAPAEQQTGRGLLFPAYCMSRITTVNSGVRRFLLTWACGREALA